MLEFLGFCIVFNLMLSNEDVDDVVNDDEENRIRKEEEKREIELNHEI